MALQSQLASLLIREISCLETLVAVLQKENDALLSADIETIESATKAKNQVLEQQATASNARLKLVADSPYSNDEQGLNAFIADSGNPQELKALYMQMTALAERCQEANRSNGRLISVKQQQVQGALGVLRQTDNSPSTYSGQGKTTPSTDTRSLGKA